ncbi:hypothetical protein BH10PLA1_BH10PLA1_02010 [soil metagenome]
MRTVLAKVASGAVALAAFSAIAYAADPAPPPPGNQPTVTWQQYQELLKQQQQMQKEMADLKKQVATQPAPAPGAAAKPAPSDSSAPTNEELAQEIKVLKDATERNKTGLENFVLSGDADVTFTNQKGSKSSFSTGVAPLILWKPSESFLFEAAFDIGIETDDTNSSATNFDLVIAEGSFIVNDFMLVGGGLFTTPFGTYHNHFDPPWINKFPDDPLAFGDLSIAPEHAVGVFVRGAVPVSTMKLTYDVYVSNGPNLNTTDPEAAGQLNFDEFSDLNDNKAVGGRIGFLPIPSLEMGYSVMGAQVNPAGFENTNAVFQAVDFNHRVVCDPLYGTFDFRAEWAWSNVDRATYDPDGTLGFGPTSFKNNRNGGYVQVLYRPTKSDVEFVRNLEFGVRYDRVTSPLSAPGGDRENRTTFGVDYWFTPSIVLKAAYELDNKVVGDNQNAFLLQLGIGL